MDCKNLMIGDWVLDGKSIIQVTSISVLGGDVVGTLTPFSSIERYYADNIIANSRGARSLDQLKPIPLTAEILAKNGFVYDRNERYVNWDIDLAVRKEGVYFILWDRVTLHYVHELQHTLRLCGLNELADNFKV